MNLLFDFNVDKETSTIHITREFAADQDLVWDAFTKSEILDQWFAPKPFHLQTKEMNFREGGRWLYAMVSQEKIAGYSLVEFLEINPKSSFTTRNSFSDENGNSVSKAVTFSITTNDFSEKDGTTTVHITKKMASLAELEKFVAMGFREGMAVVLRGLEDYLQAAMAGRK
ncbi:MAG: SRPBCC domain-containing protein [Chitinophagaceae bacterium]|nr:MAG: SRPBCC domain-containing protein [Chitinophagaceae bacterium]